MEMKQFRTRCINNVLEPVLAIWHITPNLSIRLLTRRQTNSQSGLHPPHKPALLGVPKPRPSQTLTQTWMCNTSCPVEDVPPNSFHHHTQAWSPFPSLLPDPACGSIQAVLCGTPCLLSSGNCIKKNLLSMVFAPMCYHSVAFVN